MQEFDIDPGWQDNVTADLNALGRKPSTGLGAYENPDPVEAGAPVLPGEIVEVTLEDVVFAAPADVYEFVCTSCFLVKHQSQSQGGVCLDCI